MHIIGHMLNVGVVHCNDTTNRLPPHAASSVVSGEPPLSQ